MIMIILQIVGIVFLAEFIAGVVHWLEDAYIREYTPIVGKLVGIPNVIHHHYPRLIAKHSWWHSSWDLFLLSAMFVLGFWLCGLMCWQVILLATLTTNANEFHKWEHRTRKENGAIISFLQDIYILQTPKQHARHHTDPKNTDYCTTTNLMNPVLNRIKFWSGLEYLLAKIMGIHRVPDTSVRGFGPGPDWLKEYKR